MANKYRAWASGETLTAANLVDYVQKNVVIPCDSTASYPDSSTRREGMIIYDLALDKLLVWSGTAWTPPWNTPWGVIGYSQYATNSPQQVNSSSDVTINGFSISFTGVTGRLYRASLSGSIYNGSNLDTVSGAAIWLGGFRIISTGNTMGPYHYGNISQVGLFTATGAQTIVVTLSSNPAVDYVQLNVSTVVPATLILEDMGPVPS